MNKYVLICALAAALSWPVAAQAEKNYMRVSADAEVRVQPNRAAVTFGLSEKTADLRTGAAKLNETAKRVTEYLRKRGVEERFIQTDGLAIAPVYTTEAVYTNAGKRTDKERLQYELSQTFTVTLDDPAQYEDVLYSLLDMGVNRVENVSFYSTQIRQFRDEARRMAVKHAQGKAALLAEAAGIKLGKITNIQEDSIPSWNAVRYGMSNVSQNRYDGAVQPGDGTNPAPATGMISVKAAVTLTYRVK